MSLATADSKAFLKAARRGEVATLSALLEAAGDRAALLSAVDGDGYAAVHKASYNGRLRAMALLLQQ
jgi:hypothetical protein